MRSIKKSFIIAIYVFNVSWLLYFFMFRFPKQFKGHFILDLAWTDLIAYQYFRTLVYYCSNCWSKFLGADTITLFLVMLEMLKYLK